VANHVVNGLKKAK